MYRPALVLGVLPIAACAILLTAVEAAPPRKPVAPPRRPPSPQKNLLIQLGKVQGDIQKIHAQETTDLGKVQAQFAPERARHAKRAAELATEASKLRAEQWAQLKVALDPAKAKAIREKYAADIAEIEKKIAEKAVKIERLTIKRNEKIAALEKTWFETMAALATPEKKLAELNAKERAELYKLFNSDKVKEVRANYDPQIANMEKKIVVMETAMSEASAKRQKAAAAVEAALQVKIAQIDPPVGGLSAQLALLKAERNAAVSFVATIDERKALVAELDPPIEVLKAQLKPLQEDIALVRQLASKEVAAIDAAYWAAIVAIDPPEESVADLVTALWDEEWAELIALENSPQAKAIRADYDTKKKALLKNIEHKEANLAKHFGPAQANMAEAIKNYNSAIAALDPGEVKLEYKLMLLQAKEQFEMRKAIDPAKAAAIYEKFSAKIAATQKKINDQHEEMAAAALKQRIAMNKVIATSEAKLPPLYKRANELMVQLASGK